MFTHVDQCLEVFINSFSNFRLHYSILGINGDTSKVSSFRFVTSSRSSSMVKQKFDPGAPIFGKVKGYAPWPGSVAAITSKDRFGKKIFRIMCLDIKYKFATAFWPHWFFGDLA